jgi:hypothetical protein
MSDFSKLQCTNKFTDNESRYMHICKHVCAYKRLFLTQQLYKVWCLSKLYSHEYLHKQLIHSLPNKATALRGTNVRVLVLNLGLLARTLHPEGSATGQLDQAFRGFRWS